MATGFAPVSEPGRPGDPAHARLAVDDRCTGCGGCLLTCPEHAIRPFPGAAGAAGLLVLAERCTGCLECIEVCPADAIAEV